MNGQTGPTGAGLRSAGEQCAVLVIAVFLALGAMSNPAGGQAHEAVHDGGPSENPSTQIAILVEKLGAEAWEDRERALEDLVEIGEMAVPLLTPAKSSPDFEVAWRAQFALERISRECTVESLLRAGRWEVRGGRLYLIDPPLSGLRKEDALLAIDGGSVTTVEQMRRRLVPKTGEIQETDRVTVIDESEFRRDRTRWDGTQVSPRSLTLVRDRRTTEVYVRIWRQRWDRGEK